MDIDEWIDRWWNGWDGERKERMYRYDRWVDELTNG